MPTTFGETTKSIFLNGPESHKMALQFEAAPSLGKITFGSDLGASNVFSATINGVAISPVTYGVGHDATMALIVTALKALATVGDAKISPLDARSIYFYLVDETVEPVVTNAAVAGGSAVVVTTSAILNNIYPGMPVGLVGRDELVGTIPVITAWLGTFEMARCIGVSVHTAEPGELLTAFVRGYTVVYGQADGAVTAGPVKVTGYDTITGYVKYAVTTATTDPVGWALDNVSTTEVVRIILGW